MASIGEGITSVLNWLNPFSEDFILSGVVDFLGNILDLLNPFSENFLGKKIIELLGNLLKSLFIPKEESFTAISDNVKSHFSFVDTINSTIDEVKGMLSSAVSSPSFSVPVGSTSYTNAMDVTILDFSWYAPYKEYGDIVITAFVYIAFFWRIFIKLSAIIQGLPGNTSDSTFNRK